MELKSILVSELKINLSAIDKLTETQKYMSRKCYHKYEKFLSTYNEIVQSQEEVARKFELVTATYTTGQKRASIDTSSVGPSKRPKIPLVVHDQVMERTSITSVSMCGIILNFCII